MVSDRFLSQFVIFKTSYSSAINCRQSVGLHSHFLCLSKKNDDDDDDYDDDNTTACTTTTTTTTRPIAAAAAAATTFDFCLIGHFSGDHSRLCRVPHRSPQEPVGIADATFLRPDALSVSAKHRRKTMIKCNGASSCLCMRSAILLWQIRSSVCPCVRHTLVLYQNDRQSLSTVC